MSETVETGETNETVVCEYATCAKPFVRKRKYPVQKFCCSACRLADWNEKNPRVPRG